MFQKGDYIVYRNTGVCKVAEIGIPEDFPATAQDVQYYHLAPVRGSGLIYIPVKLYRFYAPGHQQTTGTGIDRFDSVY